jgi:hypothetical protein
MERRAHAVMDVQAPNIEWLAPESCPSEDSVRQTVSRWISQSPERLDASAVHARARVRGDAETWVLDLDVESSGAMSHETLTAARCEALVQVVALKIALAAVPIETLPQEDTVTETHPARRQEPERSEITWGLRLPVGVTVGVLPKIAPSTALFGFATLSAVRMELGGSYSVQQRVEYADVPGVGMSVDVLAANARVCPMSSFDSVEMLLCAGTQVGALRGMGFGAMDVRTAYEPWVAIELGSAAVFPLSGGLKLWTSAAALLSVVRPAFEMRNLPVLYQPDAAGFQAWAGLEYRFQ